MIKLKRLKIEKLRRVAPGTELHFDDGINVLLGKNGAGKTTLLKLISMCLRNDFHEIAAEDFILEYDLELGDTFARIRFNRQERPGTDLDSSIFFAALPSIRDLLNKVLHEAEVTIELRPPDFQHPIIISFITSSSFTRIQWPDNSTSHISMSPSMLEFLPQATAIGALECTNTEWRLALQRIFTTCRALQPAYRFDESLSTFHSIIGHRGTEIASAPPSAATIVRTPEHRTSYGNTSLTPADVVSVLCDEYGKGTPSKTIIPHTKLWFLGRCTSALSLRGAEMTASLTKQDAALDNGGSMLHVGNYEFLFYLRDGSIINHDLLSYGQKRLLAFLYYIDCNRFFVIADELVNGLHHEWIEACLDAIGDRQAFLTSQNPLLLDYLPFESAEQAQRRFVQCRIEEHDGRELMRWGNMSSEDADRFFRAYQAGIQHVSEILRTKGLW